MSNLFTMDINLAFITLIGIIYVAVIFSICGIITTYTLDRYIFGTPERQFKPEDIENVSILQLVLRTSGTIAIICLCAQIISNLIQLLPFPLNGIYGYDITKTELATGHVLLIFMTVFSQTISREYNEIKYKLAGHIY